MTKRMCDHGTKWMEQLNIKTSAQLVRYAVKHGIISLHFIPNCGAARSPMSDP